MYLASVGVFLRESQTVIYLKSFGVGILLAFFGALSWIVSIFVVGLSTSRAVSIDIRSIRSTGLWILVGLLFLAGFLFELRRLQRA
jgi:hypothetical protein